MNTYLLLNGTGLDETGLFNEVELTEKTGYFRQLELMDLQGNSISEYQLTVDGYLPHRYSAPPFLPPDQYFYLKVTGVDANGYVFWRITPTALSAIIPGTLTLLPGSVYCI